MKAAVGSVLAAVAGSACCIGPVVLSALGAGALGAAAAVSLEPYRPAFLSLAAALLGVAFYTRYGPAPSESCSAEGACRPSSRRTAQIVLWITTMLVVLLATFPYYVNFLV